MLQTTPEQDEILRPIQSAFARQAYLVFAAWFNAQENDEIRTPDELILMEETLTDIVNASKPLRDRYSVVKAEWTRCQSVIVPIAVSPYSDSHRTKTVIIHAMFRNGTYELLSVLMEDETAIQQIYGPGEDNPTIRSLLRVPSQAAAYEFKERKRTDERTDT
jgi:hypothetical protein